MSFEAKLLQAQNSKLEAQYELKALDTETGRIQSQLTMLSEDVDPVSGIAYDSRTGKSTALVRISEIRLASSTTQSSYASNFPPNSLFYIGVELHQTGNDIESQKSEGNSKGHWTQEIHFSGLESKHGSLSFYVWNSETLVATTDVELSSLWSQKDLRMELPLLTRNESALKYLEVCICFTYSQALMYKQRLEKLKKQKKSAATNLISLDLKIQRLESNDKENVESSSLSNFLLGDTKTTADKSEMCRVS